MTVADRYPDARITGIDLSPIQPNFVPENARFFVDDFELEWVDPANTYDYIHIRYTLHCVRDPKLLVQRALRYDSPTPCLECPTHNPQPPQTRRLLRGPAARLPASV